MRVPRPAPPSVAARVFVEIPAGDLLLLVVAQPDFEPLFAIQFFEIRLRDLAAGLRNTRTSAMSRIRIGIRARLAEWREPRFQSFKPGLTPKRLIPNPKADKTLD